MPLRMPLLVKRDPLDTSPTIDIQLLGELLQMRDIIEVEGVTTEESRYASEVEISTYQQDVEQR